MAKTAHKKNLRRAKKRRECGLLSHKQEVIRKTDRAFRNIFFNAGILENKDVGWMYEVKIKEIEWLRSNEGLLSEEDKKALEAAGIFHWMKNGEAAGNATDVVSGIELLTKTVNKYTSK